MIERALQLFRPRVIEVDARDADLMDEIRDRFHDWTAQWAETRDERNKDLRYICGDPWDARDRKMRTDAGRPCINHDELGQYVNQCVNSVRQNKRGIKVDPQGDGSNDESAMLRQDLIRTIEYDSDAPSIYANAYQDMVEGSYAFFRVSRRYISDSSFDQEIVVKPISNPNSVLFDPTCKEPDWSDGRGCFVISQIPQKEAKRRWPQIQVSMGALDPSYGTYGVDWFSPDLVTVAEYWRVEAKPKTIYLLTNGQVVENPAGRDIEKSRKVEVKEIRQYVTNGIQILERSAEPEPGTILPIIPMVGLERYVDEGGFSKRVLFSLVRLARDPQMSLAYLNSQQMEEAGLTPKTPFIGYKGQFESSRKMWSLITKVPYAFLEADVPDNWPAGQVPPLPNRVPFTPNFAAYEVAKDSCRRAIQAAMGITPLPTAAQRAGEKSGIALQRIENEEAIGSYHFIDGYDRALRLAGRLIDQWIPAVYSGERTKQIRKPDDSYRLIRLNTLTPYPDAKTGKPVHFPVDEVDHSISISTGPSYQSQREAVADFLDTLITRLPQLPIAPPQAAKLLALAIQMRNLGPKGDEMAELISPTEGSPDQTGQQLQQAQAQLQQQGVLIQQLQAELQKLTLERQAKVVEGEYRLQSERLRAQSNLVIEQLKVSAQAASAEINTKAQNLSERMAALDEMYRQAHEQMHEARMQRADQEHEIEMQDREAAAAQQLQAQQQEQPQPQEEG